MNRKQMANIAAMLAVMAATASASASFGPGEDGSGRKEPPQEAFNACREKSEGAAVEMTTPRGDTIKAVCRQFKGQLVAVPEGGVSRPGGDQPPAEEQRQ